MKFDLILGFGSLSVSFMVYFILWRNQKAVEKEKKEAEYEFDILMKRLMKK